MIAVKGAARTVKRDPGVRYAKALAAHERIERDLARLMNRWQKSRALLKRIEKGLDAAFAAQSQGSPGEPDPAPFDDALDGDTEILAAIEAGLDC